MRGALHEAAARRGGPEAGAARGAGIRGRCPSRGRAPGSITYEHFKAPGRRHHGKVVGERLGLGVSEQRLALYCRSGSVKLIDKPFTEPQLSALEVSLERDDTVALRIDYDRAAVPKVSGQMTIRAVTPNAASVVEQLSARLGPQG